VAGAAVLVIAVVVTFLAGGSHLIHEFRPASGSPSDPPGSAAEQVVYTARTANDAAITLPAAVQQNLVQAGKAHQTIELIRVGYAGDDTTSYLDLTPRTGSSPTDPPLRVSGRAVPVIDAKIGGIQTTINSATGITGGNRALFAGLTRADFTGVPVTIISSGLDLANPDNFRALNWRVHAATLVADVKAADELPILHAPVTFVLVPTAGAQRQLTQTQVNYIKGIWTALLRASGATSVTFIDAVSTTASSPAPVAPTVPVPALSSTPIALVPAGPGQVKCTVTDSYFVFNTANLISQDQTEQNLTPCVQAALAAHATFTLDGWTSYEGPLNAEGKPEFDYAYNQTLSEERVQTIESLLVDDLGVPQSAITRATGHGNEDQPNPDPRSAANRVVVITYTVN
jgi:outer membrane protein OmpA-like peptidoglycan-associated protein